MKIFFIVFIMVNLVLALTNGLCSEQNNGTVCSGTCFGVSTCQFIFDSGKRYCLQYWDWQKINQMKLNFYFQK